MVSRSLPPLPSLTCYSMVAHRVGVGQEQETDPLKDLDEDCRGTSPPSMPGKVIQADKDCVHKVKGVDNVPEDILENSVGDRVPTDFRLIKNYPTTLRINQSILIGETVSSTMTLCLTPGPSTRTRRTLSSMAPTFPLARTKFDDFAEQLSKVITLCNNFSIDCNEHKNALEKVGEAAETTIATCDFPFDPKNWDFDNTTKFA